MPEILEAWRPEGLEGLRPSNIPENQYPILLAYLHP